MRVTLVSYPAVRDADVLAAVVPVPPLSEQGRIVDALEDHLSRFDAANAYVTRAEAAVTAMRRSWLDTNLTGQSRRLGDVLVSSKGGWSRARSHETSDGIPYLKMNNIANEGGLRLDSVVRVSGDGSNHLIERGDVLFNSKNSIDLVGKTAVADQRVAGWSYNENIIRLRFAPDVIPAFASLQLNSPRMRAQLRGIASASTNVAAIYAGALRRIDLQLPSLEQQHELCSAHEGLSQHCDRLLVELRAAKSRSHALRRSLLNAAFSGRLVPQDPADEPAELLLKRIADGRETRLRKRPAQGTK